MHKTDQF